MLWRGETEREKHTERGEGQTHGEEVGEWGGTKEDNYANTNSASSNCFYLLMHSPIHCLLLHVVVVEL